MIYVEVNDGGVADKAMGALREAKLSPERSDRPGGGALFSVPGDDGARAVEVLDAAGLGRRVRVFRFPSAQQVPRRTFLTYALGGCGLAAACGGVGSVLSFLAPPAKKLSPPTYAVAGLAEELPVGSAQLLDFRGHPVIVVRSSAARYHALSAVCTHRDTCLVQWNPDEGLLICPCHRGIFDLRGNVVDGPPPMPLSAYRVGISEGYLIVEAGG